MSSFTESNLFVLAIRANPEHGADVENVLAIVRSGLVSGYVKSDPAFANDFFGPFVLNEVDALIVQALNDEYEGFDKGAESDGDAAIVASRAIRQAARSMALAVAGKASGEVFGDALGALGTLPAEVSD